MAASTLTRRALAVMGALLAVLGVIALLTPVSYQNAVLGVGFGGLHLLFGDPDRRTDPGAIPMSTRSNARRHAAETLPRPAPAAARIQR